MSLGNFDEIDVPQSLQKLNITRMGRENQKFSIQYELPSSDGQPLLVIIYFDVKHEFGDTLEEFHKKASKRIQLRPELIQRTMAALSNDEYCRRVLEYYDVDRDDSTTSSTTTTTTANDSNNNSNNSDSNSTAATDEQEEAYASSASDPDYTDEGLKLLNVTQAVRENPGRRRVTGMIDTVRKPFKLLTAVYFTCRDRECRRRDARERHILDTPIFSLDDMSIAFNGGPEVYSRLIRCPSCRNPRALTPEINKFETAKVIELKNVQSGKMSLAVTANTTLGMESLTVLVVGKHTLSVGIGEEVEIVGELYVLESGLASSRFGGRGGGGGSNVRSFGNSGRMEPILYAKRIKYTKRKGQLKLEPKDIAAIKRFASYPNLIKIIEQISIIVLL